MLSRALLFSLAFAPAAALAASANTPRYAHTATLLVSGNLLVAGGITNAGTPTATTEIVLTVGGGNAIDGGNMATARSSHTATFLPDGRILVAGGWGGGATVTNTAELYDPATNSFTATSNNMSTGRMNHTATLLNDGRVLLCGGHTNTAGAVTTSCEIFCTDTSQTGCSGGAFRFVAAPANLQQARALHTAVLLKDGKVWFAGGWNSGATPRYLATTERFDPVLGIMNSAAPLSQGRAYHTATLMGHGKVLIAGGYNGDNATVNGNSYGLLRTAERYDPVSNTMEGAGSMSIRREMHSAVLLADTVVQLEGGLGNVTTTYLTIDIDGQPLLPGSVLMHTFGTNSLSQTTINGTSNLILPVSFRLGTPVAGMIEDGEVWFSSPQVHVGGVGDSYLVPTVESSTVAGLRSSLNGKTVGCDLAGCGLITTNLTFSGYAGVTTYVRRPVSDATGVPPTITGGSLSYTPALGTSASESGVITGGTLQVPVIFTMPIATVGSTISSATFRIVSPTGSAIFTKASSFTAVLTGGYDSFSGQIVALDALGTQGLISVNLDLSALSGVILAEADAVNVASPQTLSGAKLASITGMLDYVTSQINVGNYPFEVEVATVVVRRMVLSSPAYYDPKTNSWSDIHPDRSSEDRDYGRRGRFGGTVTLMPNNDAFVVGGRECSDLSPTCASFRAKEEAGGNVRADLAQLSSVKNWGSARNPMGTARAFHTATNLPDGRILVAGGSNGPNILRSAEVFDPASESSVFTRPMHDVRDLHSATVLPNGTVLIAGGFTTNSASTGSTNASEIFYPDTGVFLRTGVMVSSRSNHSAVTLPDGNVLVAGGFGANDIITNSAEIYYSTAGRWRATTPMATARALNTATALKDGRIMFAGGISPSGPLTSVEAYNTQTGVWTPLDSMPSPLHSHTATLLLDGRVLVTGGNDGLGEVDFSYIFDPSATPGSRWSATKAPVLRTTRLEEPRYGHNAVALPNGEVVISGGFQRFGSVTSSIEFYHASVGEWISNGVTFGSGAGVVRPRAYHTMTLASNNKLYAIGGTDGVIGGNGTKFYTDVERAYFTTDPDSHMPNPTSPFQSPRQSTILTTSQTPFLPNTLFTVTGQQFRGGTEASGGGAASANSSFSFPRLVLQGLEGSGGPGSQSNSGFGVDLTTEIYENSGNLNTLNSSVTVLTPPTNRALPFGWYHARVGANDIYSNPVAVQVGPAKPLTAPGNVVGIARGVSSMTWTWTAVAGVNGYNVYQSSTGVLISTTATTSYAQTGLASNTTASILVAGYTLSGDGPLGAGATNYTLASTATSVSIASVTFTDLLLRWSNGGNEQGTIYEVSQSTDNFSGSFSTPVPSILGLTATQVTISNLVSATTYYFRIRAYNGAGLPGNFSAIVSTLTRTKLTGVDGAAISSTQIDWSWTNPGGVLNYKVYNATTGALLDTPPGNALGYSDAPLAINSRRSILVSVVTAAGEGPLTPSATHFTLANPPLAGSPHISAISNGSFTVNWVGNNNPAYTDYRAVLYEGASTDTIADVTLPGPAFASLFKDLRPGTLYKSSVAAVNGEGIESTWLVGSTYTLAQPARNLTVLKTTPISILVSWDRQQNGPFVQWEVTYSTDQFNLHVATAVPFSSLFTGNITTITGLQTGTTYWIRVQGRTPFGTVTPFEPALATLSTVTFNGGAAAGSLAGPISANSPSTLYGTIGGGRVIEVQTAGGTFPSDVVMTVSSYNVAGPLCPGGVNVAVDISVSPALQPLKPVFLSMSFGAGEIGAIPTSRLVLFRYEPVSGACVPLETTASNGTLRAQINHFSRFQVGQVPLASGAGAARIFPNPFRTASDSYVTMAQMPPGARVRIFTLRGELVADLTANGSGLLTWRGTNGSGRAVASGLYLVIVESGSSKKILKLSLIR